MNKCYLLEYLSLGQEVAHEENEGRMEKRVDLEYFMSDNIKNHWCMVVIKSRVAFSRFYFIFVCIFLLLALGTHCWARPFSKNLQQECGLSITGNTTASQHTYYLLPICSLAARGSHSQQAAPWRRVALKLLVWALLETGRRLTWEQTLMRTIIPAPGGATLKVTFTISGAH